MTRLLSLIRQIDEFIATRRHAELLAFLKGEPEWLSALPNFTQALPSCYERHILGKTPYTEVYLMNWGADAKTGVHAHPKGGCWMRLLNGALIERREDVQTCLFPGYVGFIQGADTHSITCTEDMGALSLHIYSPRSLQ